MVLLEHVRPNELKSIDFRQVQCPCEMCDDGCFDRAKRPHAPGCQRKLQALHALGRRSPNSDVAAMTTGNTSYTDTFKGNRSARPATAAQPRPDQLKLFARGAPIDLNSTQRLAFRLYDPIQQLKSFKKIEKYEKSSHPLDTQTSYNAEYIHKDNSHFAHIVKKNPNETSMVIALEKELPQHKTTSKDHYKAWKTMQAPRTIFNGEYPSFLGQTAFPATTKRTFQTSTMQSHPPIDQAQFEKATKFEHQTTLKIEGAMDFATSYRNEFVQHADAQVREQIRPSRSAKVFQRGDDSNARPSPAPQISQTQADYSAYNNERQYPKRPPLANCNSLNTNLGEHIYPGEKHAQPTSYSVHYAQIDIDKVPKAMSFKKPEIYQPPTEKLDSLTVTERDFGVLDLTRVPLLKAKKLDAQLKIPVSQMESQTTSMSTYKPHPIKPVVLMKDPYPHHNIKSHVKAFSNFETTTGGTFKGAKATRPKSVRPKTSIKLNSSDANDNGANIGWNTQYRNTFVDHGLNMCESTAYLMSKSLGSLSEMI